MTNFNILQTAIKKGSLVTFNYLAKNGELKTRLGFVHELNSDNVVICDVHRNGYRRANINKIQGKVEFLNPQPRNPYL
jgi:predicted DNA-binding transcriptional regulator YafY